MHKNLSSGINCSNSNMMKGTGMEKQTGILVVVAVCALVLLATAILGFPGVFVLYGIHFFKTM